MPPELMLNQRCEAAELICQHLANENHRLALHRVYLWIVLVLEGLVIVAMVAGR